MTNKIVILQNSVELYEHYINDERWERTLSFPKGGLTYLISNGTIKFYAYEDYFYRNCLMSMQLPLYIIDEEYHIDGEYDDIPEIHEILDDIFPTNDIDRELSEYLKIRDAELTYQPLGDYVTTDELAEVLDDYYTKDEVDDLLDGKADKDDVYTKQEADERFQPIGDYVSGDTFSAYTAATDAAIDDLEDRKADASALTRFFDDAEYDSSAKTINFYNDGNLIDQIDARPFIKDGMVDSVSLIQLSGDTYLHIVFNTDAGKEPIDINLGDLFNADNYYTKNEVYNKQESDSRYQEKGSYVSSTTFSEYTAITNNLISNLENNKLDASAYTPTDLSNYYTKNEVYNKSEVYNKTEVNNIISAYTYSKNEIDDKIASGGTFDPSQYYNKSESDTRFALKREIPSLSGYATQQWVLDKHYVTESTIQQYITNLQQQINSIVEAVSGCCPTVETIYRWLTMTGQNDYICSGTTKYEKQIYQESHDGGMTWANVSPAQYQKGAVLETDSPDCGYTPETQYRWKAAPTSDYLCSGTSKYYKVYYEQSTDGGQTWVHVEPEQTKRGDLIEANSPDCGYIAPQYRWYTSQQEYICSGTTKLEKQYYQVSNDGGSTWSNVTPVQTRSGAILETDSPDCGYEPMVNWMGSTGETMCSGDSKYYKLTKYVSYDDGVHWNKAVPTETKPGKLIASNSYTCGYVGTPALKITDESGNTMQINCESLSSSTITNDQWNDLIHVYKPSNFGCNWHIEVGDCVTKIGDKLYGNMIGFNCAKSINYGNNVTEFYGGNGDADGATGLTAVTLPPRLTELNITFYNCTSLQTMTIPSSVRTIAGGIWMNCSSLRSLTFLSTTPPDLGDYYATTFQNTNNCTFYVPAASVDAYKSAPGWREYASRIQAIS